MEQIPRYPNSGTYAQEHGQMEEYFASRRTDFACKEAIESAIAKHYSNNTLDGKAAQDVVRQFGLERTSYVMAVTVQRLEEDGRISLVSKDWAKSVPVTNDTDPFGYDRNAELAVNTHPGLVDLFARQVRDEQLIIMPLYKRSADVAGKFDELDRYRGSRRANILCQKAVEHTIEQKWNEGHLAPDAARSVLKRFGEERVSYVLANTVRHSEGDDRFSENNRRWAKTVPRIESDEKSSGYVVSAHSIKVNEFIDQARHEILLQKPLTAEEIRSEAAGLMQRFQQLQEPNSLSGENFEVKMSPQFAERAKPKDFKKLESLLPFSSTGIERAKDKKSATVSISKDEDRTQPLPLRKPSVRKNLREKTDMDSRPKTSTGKKAGREEL